MKVSEANILIKKNIESIDVLRNISIEGEVANKKEYPTAIYFNIVEPSENKIKSSIRSIFWKKDFFNNDKDINYKVIEDGAKICVFGKIEVYVARGEYSIIVSRVNLAGEGERLLALEKLKNKLEKDGFFKHKRKINQYPETIGIITGKDSAAYKDIVFNINRRYPIVKIYFFPTIVQGEKAVASLINSLKKAYEYNLDTIIIGRGGGGIEDLNAFNDENVAKTAFESRSTIISAVGHEINKSIIDLVADRYASTPTGAAELATTDKNDILKFLIDKRERITNIFFNKISLLKTKIEKYESHFSLKNIKNDLKNKLQKVELYKKKIKSTIKIFFDEKKMLLKLKEKQLALLNIEKILKRGFAIVKDKNDKIIKESNNLNIGDDLKINFYKSKAEVKVTKKEIKK